MTRQALCAILALSAESFASGCVPPPAPQTITAPSTLPGPVLVAAAIARDAWCSSRVGWCPDLVEHGGEALIMVRDFGGACRDSTPIGDACAGAKNEGERYVIRVSPLSAEMTVEQLSGQMTHEFGHFGIDGHIQESALMRAVFETPESIPTVVDEQAAIGWCDTQRCPN